MIGAEAWTKFAVDAADEKWFHDVDFGAGGCGIDDGWVWNVGIATDGGGGGGGAINLSNVWNDDCDCGAHDVDIAPLGANAAICAAISAVRRSTPISPCGR